MSNKIIGTLHLLPLFGYPGYTSYKHILETAKKDLIAFLQGGINTIIIENNYNLPHKIEEDNLVVSMMITIIKELKKTADFSLGISVLWNDYRNALIIANETKAEFIRIPVFVDSVKTDFGTIVANPKEVIKFREDINANQVRIYADIQVKHAQLLDKGKTIEQSAIEAKENLVDGIIVTGPITGIPPMITDLIRCRSVIGKSIPLIIGSGLNKDNAKELMKLADKAIVSTSIKEGNKVKGERNIKPMGLRISADKVKELLNSL
jgi:uncharacterized protein